MCFTSSPHRFFNTSCFFDVSCFTTTKIRGTRIRSNTDRITQAAPSMNIAGPIATRFHATTSIKRDIFLRCSILRCTCGAHIDNAQAHGFNLFSFSLHYQVRLMHHDTCTLYCDPRLFAMHLRDLQPRSEIS